MATSSKTYELKSYELYPRVHYFKKGLIGFYERFKRVVGAFPSNFHDKTTLARIDERVTLTDRPPQVLVISNNEVNFSRLVVADLEDKCTVVTKEEEIFLKNGKGRTIPVCFVSISNISKHKEQEVVISMVESLIGIIGNEQNGIDTIYIVCDVNTQATNQQPLDFREHIHDYFSRDDSQWKGTYEVIFVPDNVSLESKISYCLEDQLILTFELMDWYLSSFIRKDQSDDVVNNVAHDKNVENTLYNFIKNDADLADMRRVLAEEMESDASAESEAERFMKMVLNDLPRKIRCSVVGPLSRKLNLKPWVLSSCLEAVKFENVFKQNITLTTKTQMKLLDDYSREDEQIQLSSKESKDMRSQKPCSKNDYMLHGIQNDLSKALEEIEKSIVPAIKQIQVMEKMRFEIRGYIQQTITKNKQVEVRAPIPEELRKVLSRMSGFYGMGTIYGKLEIHFRDLEGTTKTKIMDVVKQYGYKKPLAIKIVKNEATPLTNVKHGKCLKSAWPHQPNKYREGTLGLFLEDAEDKQLYAATCAHVINPFDREPHDVFVEETHTSVRKLGESTQKFTVGTGQDNNAALVDIAAFKVIDDLQPNCLRYLKDESSLMKPAYLKQESLQELEAKHVFKHGAKTKLTCGIICSLDYTQGITGGLNYLVVIENEPGSDVVFAQPGDSGSIVCMTEPDSATKSIAALSMLHCGDLTVDDDATGKYLSFLLQKGLEVLNNKSGSRLQLPA